MADGAHQDDGGNQNDSVRVHGMRSRTGLPGGSANGLAITASAIHQGEVTQTFTDSRVAGPFRKIPPLHDP